jgi:hypothetical protein
MLIEESYYSLPDGVSVCDAGDVDGMELWLIIGHKQANASEWTNHASGISCSKSRFYDPLADQDSDWLRDIRR